MLQGAAQGQQLGKPMIYLDAYDVLGLEMDCSEDDIKKAYKKLSLLRHPDKQRHMSAADAAQDFTVLKVGAPGGFGVV